MYKSKCNWVLYQSTKFRSAEKNDWGVSVRPFFAFSNLFDRSLCAAEFMELPAVITCGPKSQFWAVLVFPNQSPKRFSEKKDASNFCRRCAKITLANLALLYFLRSENATILIPSPLFSPSCDMLGGQKSRLGKILLSRVFQKSHHHFHNLWHFLAPLRG